MAQYIATFFTHFDALDCSRTLKKQGIPVQLAPVPRALSSSCGTCAYFQCEQLPEDGLGDSYESVYRAEGETYTLVLDNRQ